LSRQQELCHEPAGRTRSCIDTEADPERRAAAIQRSIKGVEYFSTSGPTLGSTPKEVLLSRGTMNLYHYRPLADEVYRVPVLIVMATTNRGYILVGRVAYPSSPHDEAWEALVRALSAFALRSHIYNMDEMRHAIECIAPRHYISAPYYERHLTASRRSLSKRASFPEKSSKVLSVVRFPCRARSDRGGELRHQHVMYGSDRPTLAG
jgi:hypothetical protein